jgi:hypothetical protein
VSGEVDFAVLVDLVSFAVSLLFGVATALSSMGQRGSNVGVVQAYVGRELK